MGGRAVAGTVPKQAGRSVMAMGAILGLCRSLHLHGIALPRLASLPAPASRWSKQLTEMRS